MKVLKSDPGLTMQHLHGDNPLVGDEYSPHNNHLKMLSVIVALEDNTTLDIMIEKTLSTVSIPKGSMIIFDSAIGHSGSPNPSNMNIARIHCKMKSDNVIVERNTVVPYYYCQFNCGDYRDSEKKIKEHHRNCRLNPKYEHRRAY